MASAAPPKRMVSSVFITLASPYRATVTQQQHACKTHDALAGDIQHTAVQVQAESSNTLMRRKGSAGTGTQGGSAQKLVDSASLPQTRLSVSSHPSATSHSEPGSVPVAEAALGEPKPRKVTPPTTSEELSPPPPPPPVFVDTNRLTLGDSPLPPPPILEPSLTAPLNCSFPDQTPAPNKQGRTAEPETTSPRGEAGTNHIPVALKGPDHIPVALKGPDHIQQALKGPDHIQQALEGPDSIPQALKGPDHIQQALKGPDSIPQALKGPDHIQQALEGPDCIPQALKGPDHIQQALEGPDCIPQALKGPDRMPEALEDPLGPEMESREVCGFCRKPVALSDPAIDALNRTYHDSCFQCRQCHIPLAGKLYYNNAGIPLCEDCYQASLELCWVCGDVIKDHVIRALERAYHPACFTCATCSQPIGEQRFAQGEVGEVYCLQDYYRKYAPECSACQELIIPREDGTDSYTVECLGRSFHEDCYRCEVCVTQLSPEPNDHGCYPLDGRVLCKSCHLTLVQSGPL